MSRVGRVRSINERVQKLANNGLPRYSTKVVGSVGFTRYFYFSPLNMYVCVYKRKTDVLYQLYNDNASIMTMTYIYVYIYVYVYVYVYTYILGFRV